VDSHNFEGMQFYGFVNKDIFVDSLIRGFSVCINNHTAGQIIFLSILNSWIDLTTKTTNSAEFKSKIPLDIYAVQWQVYLFFYSLYLLICFATNNWNFFSFLFWHLVVNQLVMENMPLLWLKTCKTVDCISNTFLYC
jgi:hypothetical protein